MTGLVSAADQCPVLQPGYIKRYGDVEHKERIEPYVVTDLSLSYTKKNIWQLAQLKLSLELSNITNEKYIAVINSFDDTRASTTTQPNNTSYYQGAPFSAIGTLAVNF